MRWFLRQVRKVLRRIGNTGDRLLLTCGIIGRRKRAKIDPQLNKLVFVGHSYHQKTHSSEFILDLLRSRWQVEVVLDESWLGQKDFPDLSFVDQSFLAIVFWQVLPPLEQLRGLSHANMLFFPMYDGVSKDFQFWTQRRQLKVVSFSSTLTRLLKGWHHDVLGVKYFPKPLEFSPGKRNEVFFWQRLTRLSINEIAPLFPIGTVKIHLHTAVDPGQTFVEPTHEISVNYSVTTSTWFDHRQDLLDLVQRKGVYIAPREFEGIGMSFLEAMAMGKAVIAVDQPTMNEYITHGETGYLIEQGATTPIDLSKLEQVQRRAYESIVKGYPNWLRDQQKILDWILKG